MHDTVTKLRRRIRDGGLQETAADLFSQRLQGGGLSRALSEPLSAHLEQLYTEAFNWIGIAGRAVEEKDEETRAGALGELVLSCRHLAVVLESLIPFLERAEDNLGEREEITHRESGYERDVVPFSRLESTNTFRAMLAAQRGFSSELASQGAQAEADLLKVLYLEFRLQSENPKPIDLYAMIAELLLDGRRHLQPTFAEGSDFMRALTASARVG